MSNNCSLQVSVYADARRAPQFCIKTSGSKTLESKKDASLRAAEQATIIRVHRTIARISLL